MASSEQQKRFLEGRDKPSRESKPPKPLAPGKRPRRSTPKQDLLNAKWAGIRDAYLYLMDRLDPDGLHCEGCGRPAKRNQLDLDHIVSRGRSGEYTAANAQLLCNKNLDPEHNCHDAKTGVPWPEKHEAKESA